ncbi:MAG: glutamate--tRNA ligase [Holosporaceae bacterium]|jgi:glutamyl-tRNA synthetase|nr:glutamate--tRNA ligase [Holosporaceae bacterium]
MVRVRFAPSPTGLLHVGNVRIAILNYLFAKKNSGKFVLRIDDTDSERSSKESENLILEDLKWLGIQWDEFYRQSANYSKYKTIFDRLRDEGRVYPCYETKEELSLKRKIQASIGAPPVYDRAALGLSEKERAENEAKGVKPHWRFKLAETQSIEWEDLIHGKISICLNSVSDPIVVKPDGSFVYTFASVVDDVDMGITHIIRGDDHITNTAAQMDIFRAISGKYPIFAHVPLLSAIDGQDVSKRFGSPLSIANMRKDCIEPLALWYILATLGTSQNVNYEDDIDALIVKFSFKRMSLSSPKFNPEEIKLLTKKIIAEKTFNDAKTDLEKLNLKNISQEFWNMVKGNLHTIKDIVLWEEILYNKINVIKEDENFVNQMLKTLEEPVNFERWMKNLSQVSKRKGKELFHPVRVVLTGLSSGPALAEMVNLLGYERIKSRIESNLKTKS